MEKDNNNFGKALSEHEYWNQTASRIVPPHFQKEIALYKKKVHLDLVYRWALPGAYKRLLKTDLFEEAFGKDSLLEELSTSYGQAIGIDISGEVVARAKGNFPHNPLLVSDVRHLPFKDRSFDLIVSNSTLDHLRLGTFSSAIRELWRILQRGGCLILTLDSRHNPPHLLSHTLRNRMGRFHVERCYSMGETVGLLEGCGFHVLDHTVIYHIPPGINFLAKHLQSIMGNMIQRLMECFLHLSRVFDALPTRYLTGRYIAIKVLKPTNSLMSEKTRESGKDDIKR